MFIPEKMFNKYCNTTSKYYCGLPVAFAIAEFCLLNKISRDIKLPIEHIVFYVLQLKIQALQNEASICILKVYKTFLMTVYFCIDYTGHKIKYDRTKTDSCRLEEEIWVIGYLHNSWH